MRTISLLGVVSAAVVLAPLSMAQSTWPNVNLPTTFQPVAGGFTEDFEAAAGVIPSYMNTSSINMTTGLPDPLNWCNIGNLAPCISAVSGSYSLEMGQDPTLTTGAGYDVQNSMVLGLDGAGTTSLYVSFAAQNHGEESHPIDGVWVSDDGTNWYNVSGNWSATVPTGGAWEFAYNIDLTGTAASTSGQFYLMFGEQDNFPFGYLDGIGIDDIQVTENQLPIPPPVPSNFPWVVLPGSFENVAGGWSEGFEAAAGVLAPYMAVTEIDTTFVASANASANIGQNGPFSAASNSGSYHLEMASIASGSPNTINALTLGLNGAGATDFNLAFYLYENNDEVGPYDGVFISDNGTDWTPVDDGQGGTSWAQKTAIDMSFQGQNPVDLSGDFYLMFIQSDNSSWSGGDGNAYDDINVGPLPPTPPSIALSGTCGANPSSVDVSGATPGGQVAAVPGTNLTPFVVGASQPCAGLILDLTPVVQFLQVGTADANGDISFTGGSGALPANACGVFSVQAVDLTTCLATSVLAL